MNLFLGIYEGFNVVINPGMTRKEYVGMMGNPALIAYYMDAHGNYDTSRNASRFSLLKEKPDFSRPDWPISIRKESSCNAPIIPKFFADGKIQPRPDLLAVYQVSCENLPEDWKAYLGESVKHFHDRDIDDNIDDDNSYFNPERIKDFADEVIEKAR